MSDNPTKPEPAPARDTGALLLAAGGLAAAVGAASCCALPMLLGSIGLGGAWLATVAWFAAPYRITLLAAAILCLAAGGVVFLWRRRATTCAPEAVCGRPATTVLLTGTLITGGILVVLGYLYA